MGSWWRSLVLAVCVGAASGPAFGWGCSGHQIVALIAQKQLSASARRAVLDLLSGSPIDSTLRRFCGRTTLGPLADVATWADDYRDQEPATSEWHFVDIPLSVTARPGPREFCERGCVTDAVERQLAVLRSADAQREDKVKALMFVVHFVGDMHQPLHDVSNNDRGGNCVPVTFLELEPRQDEKGNYAPNLHGLWDSGILERQARIRRESRDADVARVAADLTTRYGAQIASWKTAAIDVPAWAWEGRQLAATVTYGQLPARVAPEAPVGVSTCADADNIGQRMAALHERVGPAYLAAVTPVIERQLAKAGARLARVLNAAFAPAPRGPGR